MVNNTTSMLNLVSESTTTNDSIEAILFIIFVLLWYSSSIVFLLGMQMRTSNEILENSPERASKLFVESLRVQRNNKEILEELVDRQKRDKLWNIYLGTGDMNDKIVHADVLRIRNIEKQLAVLNEEHNQRILGEKSIIHSDSALYSSDTDLSTSNSRSRTRRRSSLDQKILKEWKVFADELKAHENWPWGIQKLLIRRHLRRQRYATEP